jgi:hypothetical protein
MAGTGPENGRVLQPIVISVAFMALSFCARTGGIGPESEGPESVEDPALLSLLALLSRAKAPSNASG